MATRVGYIDTEEEGENVEEIDIDDIVACTDEATLARWHNALSIKSENLREFIKAHRLADTQTEDWFQRAAGKVAYTGIGIRRIERHMRANGIIPPGDQRGKIIKARDDKIHKLRALLLQHGIEIPPEGGA
jgi:hypothetical protein